MKVKERKKIFISVLEDVLDSKSTTYKIYKLIHFTSPITYLDISPTSDIDDYVFRYFIEENSINAYTDNEAFNSLGYNLEYRQKIKKSDFDDITMQSSELPTELFSQIESIILMEEMK